jgi:hypothetical protein
LRGRKAASGLYVLKKQAVGSNLLRLSILVDEDVPLGAYAIVVVDAQGTPSNSVSLEVVL